MKLDIYLALLKAGKTEEVAQAVAEAISDLIDQRFAMHLQTFSANDVKSQKFV